MEIMILDPPALGGSDEDAASWSYASPERHPFWTLLVAMVPTEAPVRVSCGSPHSF